MSYRNSMDATTNITRGTCRLLIDLGHAPLLEFPLKNGRRLDVLALGSQQELVAVEVKSSKQDFTSDQKWPEYLEFCDQFYFAVAPDFPHKILPDQEGLIVADRYGAEIVRAASPRKVSAARRRAMVATLARLGALRLQAMIDPQAENQFMVT